MTPPHVSNVGVVSLREPRWWRIETTLGDAKAEAYRVLKVTGPVAPLTCRSVHFHVVTCLQVIITSDRDRQTLAAVTEDLPVYLAPEGCCIMRRPGETEEWIHLVEDSDVEGREEWMDGVNAVTRSQSRGRRSNSVGFPEGGAGGGRGAKTSERREFCDAFPNCFLPLLR